MSPNIPADRVGVCTWSLQPRSAEDLVDRLGEVDLDRVQLALCPILDEPERFGDVGRRFEAAGVRILSGMVTAVGEDYSTLESIRETGGVRPDRTWPLNLERAPAAAELAAGLGIELVTMHVGFIPHRIEDCGYAILLERIRTIADRFWKHGIKLGLETGQETAATLIDTIRVLDHEGIRVNFDPANMLLYGMGDPIDAIERLSPWVAQVHIKDARRSEIAGVWGAETRMGEGEIDWDGFLGHVLAIDPPVDVLIEREAGCDRVGDIRDARRLLIGD